MEVTWDIIELIAKELEVPYKITKNVVNLLDNDNTIPFIARYRKEQTGDMEPNKIRQVKEVLTEFRAVKHRIATVRETINKQGKLNPALNQSLRSAKSMAEVEMLYAPYKPGSKGSYAERAREAGLEPPAESILNNNTNINFNTLIQPSSSDYSTVADVKKGLQHIIADIIAKNTEAKETINSLFRNSYITLESTKTKKAATTASKKEPKAKKGKPEMSKKSVEEHKFQNYFDFKCSIKTIKPHQVLAINRGEDNKILSVKVVIPDNVKRLYTIFCCKKWIRPTAMIPVKSLIEESISDAYDRLVTPQMIRQVRSDLTKNAEKASIDVFCSNLKKRLLVSTVKQKVVLALDPGFFHGCKLAVISRTGQVLYTDILYLNSKANSKVSEEQKLSNIVSQYSCEIIAIGNGTACRETETKVSDLIRKKAFGNLKVCYCIVDESGASIYSVSDVAKDELPDLDHSLRGAVSIARRLQDPLAELVKIEPKHIGVGMYQHDVADSKLKDGLDCIVGECVSFVGVDLNTCSEHLLRKVAGLNATRAKNIIAWRIAQGKFNNREQLKLIKGLGQKTFDQCAGFIRILSGLQDSNKETASDDTSSDLPKTGSKRKAGPSEGTSKSKKAKLGVDSSINPLDRTWIHPESYHVAKKFIKKTGASIDDIGFPKFIDKVKQLMRTTDVKKLAEELNVGEPTMKLMVDGLLQPINYDLRDEYEKPLFRTEITSLKDLTIGQKLSGRVSNVTHFGAFVDIGVGIDGLVHVSKMNPDLLRQNNRSKLELGDRIEVMVVSLDLEKSRIGLSLSLSETCLDINSLQQVKEMIYLAHGRVTPGSGQQRQTRNVLVEDRNKMSSVTAQNDTETENSYYFPHNRQHHYLNDIELSTEIFKDVDLRFGCPTKTSLLRSRQWAASTGALSKQLKAQILKIQLKTPEFQKAIYSERVRPSSAVGADNSYYGFLTGGRYNWAHLIDGKCRADLGLYVPRSNPNKSFFVAKINKKEKTIREKTASGCCIQRMQNNESRGQRHKQISPDLIKKESLQPIVQPQPLNVRGDTTDKGRDVEIEESRQDPPPTPISTHPIMKNRKPTGVMTTIVVPFKEKESIKLGLNDNGQNIQTNSFS